MPAVSTLAVLALQQVVRGASQAAGGALGEAAVEATAQFLSQRFTDQSQRLTAALQKAQDQAWRALEVALAGDGWWDQLQGKLAPADHQAFRQQVQALLQAARVGGVTVDRGRALEQLRAARQAGQLTPPPGGPDDLARQAGALARFRDPAALLQAETAAVIHLADQLRAGYPHLAAFLTLQARQGEALLAVAVRYFFRRAVEEDAKLAQGLAFAQLERLQETQERGFAALRQVLGRVAETVAATHEAVLDVRAEQQRQGAQHQALYEAVLGLHRRLELMHQEVRPRDSLSIRTDDERRLVREVVQRYRQLPEDQRRNRPALLNALGRLEVAAGDFQAAEQTFRAVAHQVDEPGARAEAHHNAYRAALERRELAAAFRHLIAAVKLDARRFAPFPVGRFLPRGILGAGGFGVAFLCEHREFRHQVVVKALFGDGPGRDMDAVLGEARALWQIDHPAVIRVTDCGYVEPRAKGRPYLVMPFFEGRTLEEQARRQPLPVEEFLAVARLMVGGLQAAHGRGILHRDVKPANVLVRQEGPEAWQVKLIDFGLAVPHVTLGATARPSQTLLGSSIAGTLEYAAPEQLGRLPGVGVGKGADVYGFGRTCCFALFGTPAPVGTHWKSVPPKLAELLERCLAERPEHRLQDFDQVAELLAKVRRPRRKAAPGRDAEPEPELAPDPLAPAAALLDRLARRFDPAVMDELGAALRQLRRECPGPGVDDLVHRTRQVLAAVIRPGHPAYRAGPGETVSVTPAGAALGWAVTLRWW